MLGSGRWTSCAGSDAGSDARAPIVMCERREGGVRYARVSSARSAVSESVFPSRAAAAGGCVSSERKVHSSCGSGFGYARVHQASARAYATHTHQPPWPPSRPITRRGAASQTHHATRDTLRGDARLSLAVNWPGRMGRGPPYLPPAGLGSPPRVWRRRRPVGRTSRRMLRGVGGAGGGGRSGGGASVGTCGGASWRSETRTISNVVTSSSLPDGSAGAGRPAVVIGLSPEPAL